MFARPPVLKFLPRFFQKACAGSGRVAPYTPFLFCKLFSLRLFPTKKKAAKKAEKPSGYSRLASANSLPAFLFDYARHKEKS